MKHLEKIVVFALVNAGVTILLFKESPTTAIFSNIVAAFIVLLIFHQD